MSQPKELAAKLRDEVTDRWRTAGYMKKLREEAIIKTKSRKRTNDIYDPEYCAFDEGYSRGWVMALDGASQHRTENGGFYNDPTVIESIEAIGLQMEEAIRVLLVESKTSSLLQLKVWLVEENEGYKRDRKKFKDIDQRMACDTWIKSNQLAIKKIDHDLKELGTYEE